MRHSPIPNLALILVGYGLERARFLSEAAWLGMERLTFVVLCPALLIRALAGKSVSGTPWRPLTLMALFFAGLSKVVWHDRHLTECQSLLFLLYLKEIGKNVSEYRVAFVEILDRGYPCLETEELEAAP